MAETKMQSIPEPQTAALFIEQRIAAGNQFDGNAPSLGGVPFVPWVDAYDQVFRYALPTVAATKEGDKGGLFEFECAAPVSLEEVLADFGSAVAWTLAIVTRSGAVVVIDSASSSRYLVRTEYQRLHLARGDKVRIVTTGATAAMWARIALTLNQGMR